MGFAQQCCLVGFVQICVVGDGVQGKGIPSPASAIQKPGVVGFRLLFRADSAAHAVRMVADEVFCRLPKNGSRQKRPAGTSLIAKHAMYYIRISNFGTRLAFYPNTPIKAGTTSLIKLS